LLLTGARFNQNSKGQANAGWKLLNVEQNKTDKVLVWGKDRDGIGTILIP
jgi:hypothetical protein